jgi:hypothetical protein
VGNGGVGEWIRKFRTIGDQNRQTKAYLNWLPEPQSFFVERKGKLIIGSIKSLFQRQSRLFLRDPSGECDFEE